MIFNYSYPVQTADTHKHRSRLLFHSRSLSSLRMRKRQWKMSHRSTDATSTNSPSCSHTYCQNSRYPSIQKCIIIFIIRLLVINLCEFIDSNIHSWHTNLQAIFKDGKYSPEFKIVKPEAREFWEKSFGKKSVADCFILYANYLWNALLVWSICNVKSIPSHQCLILTLLLSGL